MSPPFKTHELLTHDGIAHGFFGREGGVSEGQYASLNVGQGSQDQSENITENRSRVATALGTTCLLYTSPSPRDKRQSRMPSSA